MDYLDLSIEDIHEAILQGKVSPKDLVLQAISRAKADQNNSFEYICEKEALQLVEQLDNSKKHHPLWGIPFVLKDNFSTKDIPTTASSNMLKDYVPVFSSEVYQRLIAQGAILIGKTTLDEFGMGGTGTNGHLGITYNPWDKKHIYQVGGSSSGSASATSSGIVPFAIGSDTGDSVRKPASFTGLVGFKPTWGRISRYGLFNFSPSLDTVGFFTRSVKDSAIVLEAIAGKDEKDHTSSNAPVEQYYNNISNNVNGLKIAIIQEIYDAISNVQIKNDFHKIINELKSRGAIINYVSIDKNLLKVIYPTYIVISSTDASSNFAHLDGIKFGLRGQGNNYQEMVTDARTKGFSYPVKRRFILGGYSIKENNKDNIYLKAQKCRHLFADCVNKILKDNDVICLPTTATTAPFINDISIYNTSEEHILTNDYLILANFAGLPSISVPLGFDKHMPFGLNIMGKAFDEQMVLNISLAVEEITGLKNIMAREKKS